MRDGRTALAPVHAKLSSEAAESACAVAETLSIKVAVLRRTHKTPK